MGDPAYVATLGLAYRMPHPKCGTVGHIVIFEPTQPHIEIWSPDGASDLGGRLPNEDWTAFNRWQMKPLVILR
jgi:hypothetical protein